MPVVVAVRPVAKVLASWLSRLPRFGSCFGRGCLSLVSVCCVPHAEALRPAGGLSKDSWNVCVKQINVWWRRSGPCSKGVTLENKLCKRNVFIPSRFQFPFLNIRVMELENFSACYTDGGTLRNYSSNIDWMHWHSRRTNCCSSADLPSNSSSSLLLLETWNWWAISFGATKPPAHPEDGDGVSSRNVGKPSHLDAAVCRRKFRYIRLIAYWRFTRTCSSH